MIDDYVWPPHCCVAAFVDAAIRTLCGQQLDRASLARDLKTVTAPGLANPWGLDIDEDPSAQGVLARTAVRQLGTLLQRVNSELSFRHIRFSTIAFEQYPDVFGQAISLGNVVGIGFDYSLLFGESLRARHVARARLASNPTEVVLVDDSHRGKLPVVTVDWPALERAVFAVDDGFWVIGPRHSLALNHTLPA
jgi:hypothetical protein